MDLKPQADEASFPAGDQTTDDHQKSFAMSSLPQANEREYLEWKISGHPLCPRCRKSHFGTCKSSQWEVDFINQDPEEYVRRRTRLKQQKRRRKQSQIERTGTSQATSPDAGLQRGHQNTLVSSNALHDAPPDFDQQRDIQTAHTPPEDISTFVMRFLAEMYCKGVPRDLVEVPDFNAVSQHFRVTGVVDWTATSLHSLHTNNEGSVRP